MVIDGQWVTTADEIKRQKGDALLALQEAKQELRFLREEIALKSRRLLKVAELLSRVEASDEYLGGPAVEILRLPDSDYGDSQSLKTIKALAQALVVAVKKVCEAQQRVRDLGAGD